MPGLQLKYFVLKPKGNDPYAHASRMAMEAYANTIKLENETLAKELGEWILVEILALTKGDFDDNDGDSNER